jgi:cytochrome P450
MMAGYETTSTSLAYCTYVLATNQEEQQTLRDEIDNFYDNNPDVINFINFQFKKVVLIYFNLKK